MSEARSTGSSRRVSAPSSRQRAIVERTPSIRRPISAVKNFLPARPPAEYCLKIRPSTTGT